MTPALPLCSQYWYKHRHQCVIERYKSR